MKRNLLIATNAQKVLYFLIDHPAKDFLESGIQKTTKISKSGINYALRDLVAGFQNNPFWLIQQGGEYTG